MESFSLFELNQYIKQVVALNFAEPIWIHGEIGQIGLSRGNYYIDIIQKDEKTDTIKAQASSTLWYKSYLSIKKKIAAPLDVLLQQGVEVKLKVQVEFHERYGMKLNVIDVDPNYTLGQLEIIRQQNIQRLQDADLIEKNAEAFLPTVLQNIAVISSGRAAGYKDFVEQLKNNEYGYVYNTTLFDCAVQGQNVKKEVPQALSDIAKNSALYDCVIIIRGGGSKMDLAGFDEYDVGIAIANSPIPIITGIGHEIDQSIADIVSHTAVKTPTAAAEFLIQRTMQFESRILGIGEQIKYQVQNKLSDQYLLINNLSLEIKRAGLTKVDGFMTKLDHSWENIRMTYSNRFSNLDMHLDNIENTINLLDPKLILERGYAYLSNNGESIHSIDQLQKGDSMDITLKDGKIKSTVQTKTKL